MLGLAGLAASFFVVVNGGGALGGTELGANKSGGCTGGCVPPLSTGVGRGGALAISVRRGPRPAPGIGTFGTGTGGRGGLLPGLGTEVGAPVLLATTVLRGARALTAGAIMVCPRGGGVLSEPDIAWLGAPGGLLPGLGIGATGAPGVAFPRRPGMGTGATPASGLLPVAGIGALGTPGSGPCGGAGGCPGAMVRPVCAA